MPMKLTIWLKRKLTGRHESLSRELAERLRHLPKEQARKELGSLLYELAVRHVTAFVKDELSRGDSPFSGAPAAVFFHEMLAVTFWIMDNELAGGKKTLASELHDHYGRSYSSPDASTEERSRALLEKYKRYGREWDDVGGFQDEFGLYVAQNIFGPGESDRTRERTFWIIRYVHDVMGDIVLLKKVCRQAGFTAQQTAEKNR